MRRKEREITDFEEIIKILDESNFLTLAMINGISGYTKITKKDFQSARFLKNSF